MDCADPACSHDACCADPAKPSPEDCSNGVDDDCDGAVDCADPDCSAAPCCADAPTPEDCFNGIDDDCDGSVDCADSDCPWGGCPCTDPGQCPLPPGPCETRTCEDGTCSTEQYVGEVFDPPGDCSSPYCAAYGLSWGLNDGDAPLTTECAPVFCFDGSKQSYTAEAGQPCGHGLACDGQGHCVGCTDASSCPDGGACRTPACLNGACGYFDRPDGYVLNQQVIGDCRVAVCRGGQAVQAVDDTDTPDDGEECTWDVCTNGTETNPPRPPGASCTGGLSHVCDGAGSCS